MITLLHSHKLRGTEECGAGHGAIWADKSYFHHNNHDTVAEDLGSLVKSCWEQKRVVDNAPCVVSPEDIESMYKDCMQLW